MITIARRRPTGTPVGPLSTDLLVRPDLPESEAATDLAVAHTKAVPHRTSATRLFEASPRRPRSAAGSQRSLLRVIARRICDHSGYQNSPSQQALEAIADTAYFRHR